MKISKINQNLINYNYQNSQVSTTVYENNIQASVYNQKGVTLPFGARFKPTLLCEYECIQMLKKNKRKQSSKIFTRRCLRDNDIFKSRKTTPRKGRFFKKSYICT